MDRRTFVLGMLAAGSSTLTAGPVLGHSSRRDVVRCGAHLLSSARVAVRRSRRFAKGLTIEIASRPAVLVKHASRRLSRPDPVITIRGLADSLELSFDSRPWRRLERNLRRLEDRLDHLLDRHEAHHFIDHWHHPHWTTFETREHLDACSACRRSYDLLIRDTDLEWIPIAFDDEVTVFSGTSGVRPVKELHLPKVPTGMRSAMHGKTLQLRAKVDAHGRARVVGVDSADFSSFVVQRAIDMIEDNPWHPGRDARGYSGSRNVRIQFQW